MACPICKGAVKDAANRPFCSARCKAVDLGRWLDGDYKVPGPPGEIDEDEVEQVIDARTKSRKNEPS